MPALEELTLNQLSDQEWEAINVLQCDTYTLSYAEEWILGHMEWDTDLIL